MRKLVLFLSMILVGVGSVFAQYVWKGGTQINSSLWAGQASWENWDPTTIRDYRGVGPATANSGSWDEIQIKGTSENRISGETPNLEGWNLKMVLDYATVTIPSVTKMQAPNGDAYFTLSGNSVLNFNWGKTTQQHSFSVNLNAEDASVFNFFMGSNYGIDSEGAISVNYGVVSNGMLRRINVSSKDGSTARTLYKLVINATLPEVKAETATLNSAVIATAGTGVTITTKTYNITSNGYTEAAADTDLSSDLSNNVGKYKIVESGGDIVLQWVTGPVSAITFNYTATFEEGNTFTTSLVRYYEIGTVLTEAPSLASEFYTAEPISHTVSADAAVNVTLNPKFPFVHNVPTWLSSVGNTTNGGLRQVKYVSDSQVAIDVNGNSKVVSKEHAWTFVHVNGTADQFQIRNGLGKYLNASTTSSAVCTVSETPQTFTIQKSAVTSNNVGTEVGFCIKVADQSYMGAHKGNSNSERTIGNITTWTNNQLGTWKDAGSTVSNNGNLFYAVEPSDAELCAIRWDNVTFQMKSGDAYASSAKAIASGDRGTSTAVSDYKTYWTLVPTSTTAVYKVKNEYSGFYLGSAATVNLTESKWAGTYKMVEGTGDTQKLRLTGESGESGKYLAIDAEGKLSLTVDGTEWNIKEISTEGLQSVRSGYEAEKEFEIADIIHRKTQYIGSGVGQYTPTSEQSNVILDAIVLGGNMGSLTGNEIDKKVIPAQELFSVGKMTINQPVAGFYRIKYTTNASTPYLGTTGPNDGYTTIDMTAAEDVSSIFYIEEGEEGKKYLMMYTSGYYVANPFRYGVGTKIIRGSEIYKQSWTVEEGDFGKYALKYGGGNYLTGNAAKTYHASEKNANSNAWTFEPQSSLPLSTNEDGYTSFSAPVPVTIPENCYAYAATSKGYGVINMSKVIGNVAANTGLIIKTENPSAALTFNIVETGDAVDNNKLVANVAAAEVDKESNYFFGKYGSEYVFTKISGTGNRDLMGHKAYLDGESFSGARLNIYWDEQVETGIENTEGVLETTRNGLFIENGRVLVVKEGRRYTTAGQRMR